ncbi:hypothetical protein DNTS_035319, partial [Danionella cerebrum]
MSLAVARPADGKHVILSGGLHGEVVVADQPSSLTPILISHTQTNPSPPPLTIFQSSACTA